ncbi:Pfs, NB-ARC and TPR domain protein [Aspergillus alliaceus]|uniref:Pfs, NB-ARC and TPR domain protein n=1 Tax=Petromyces alliaceus TaxID=209559 RepID=UPI0012A76328|nr:Pfs, NB-ARC and TPR domain protein [Aspergillus alliaceus]KAB8231567.1 Pfs, NB-ARC and TPR domain protein [Aspergillus alliaceus]
MAPLSHADYTVGWICALPLEMAAARAMLDEIHDDLPVQPNDHNAYILGRIKKHNVVIACLPNGEYGIASATTVAIQLLSSFHSIRFGLMVGVGGAVPNRDADIRLGDVVVSKPTDTHGGVVQYDYGKALSGGDFQRTGMLNRPPQILLTALSKLHANHLTEESQIPDFLADIKRNLPKRAANFARPTQLDDLYLSDYNHANPQSRTCDGCDIAKTIPRLSRNCNEPVIHYGLIASANQVVKDSQLRDKLGREFGVYCVEMEAAGLMNNYPCIVVRGICDYADSHKNKDWQGYAAAVAAAYAKELLSCRFRVPFDLTAVPVIENFLGRQDELQRLWHYLRPVNPQLRKVAILHGPGGMGKTQLAVRFARDHKNDFTTIFWLSGKDRGTLLRSLSSVFSRLPGQSHKTEVINEEEVEQRARHVLQWLALEGNSRWLIIFDNIDQYSLNCSNVCDGYDISEFFPTADHGSILITSRLRRLTDLGKSFPVQRLESKYSIQLLLQSSGMSIGNNIKNVESDPDTLALTGRLDGLPLAIVIAGAFIHETGTSITDYLRYYEESWYDLQSQSSPGRQYQQGNLLQTWMISYRKIQKQNPDAAELLLLLAHFDSRDIWYELVKSASHSSNTPAWFDSITPTGLTFKNCMKILIGFSLIETKPQEGSFTMHPVIQDWCLYIASSRRNANLVQLSELALISVGYAVPGIDERNYAEIQRRLIPHANYVRHGDVSRDNAAAWGAFHGLGNLYSNQGKLKEAEQMYQRALAGSEKALGPDHISTLEIVNNLGVLYKDQGKLKKAEQMFQRVLVDNEKALGPDHIFTLGTVNNLGIIYSDQGKLKKAEQVYQQALAGREKALGPDHISTLFTVNNLGLLYRDQGKLKEAEQMYQRALAGFEEALGPDHTSTLFTVNNLVNNLGLLYSDQGKLKEAERMYQRALAGYKEALGPDHISTLFTVNNLGLLYRDQGKLKEAESIYQQALVGCEKTLSPDYISTLGIVHNLGLLYRDQGKLKEAEKIYQRVLAGREKTLGPDHISTLFTVNNIGNLYSDQGKLKEAERMYQRALAGKEKALGPDHTSTLFTVNNLGILYSNQGKLKEAESMYQRALAGYEKALGPDHHKTQQVADRLSALMRVVHVRVLPRHSPQ